MKNIIIFFLVLFIVQIGFSQGITVDDNRVTAGETVYLHVGTCGIDFGGVWVYEWDEVSGLGLPAEGCVGSQDGEHPTYVYEIPGNFVVAYRAFDMGPPINCVAPCDTLHIKVLPICTALQFPVDASTGISLNPILIWDSVPGVSSYDVYFGENGSMTYFGEISDTTYAPSVLEYLITYEWQIIPKSDAGDAESCDIWTFTTEEEQVGINSANNTGLKILPNPANNYIKICSENIIWQIIITDFIGKLCGTYNPNKVKTEIDLSKFNAGMYLFIIETETGIKTEKIIIEK